MSETLKFKGRLQEKELEAKNLKLQIRGLIDSLRDKLDPTIATVDLEEHVISAQALEFADKMINYRDILAEIKLIKKTLGK